jgi:polyisoprenoid-binding protein YceI
MSVIENTSQQLLSSGSWQVDPAHSAIEFRVRHMVIETVKGRFRDFDGTVMAGATPTVRGSIRAASLDTLHEERDEHLRSADFFDVERYPEITFEANTFRFNGDNGRFALPGELTIKGVTRPLTLDGEFRGAGFDLEGSERVALALHAQLERSDFGLVWNRILETGGLRVGNTVELALDLSAVRVD